jgi:hypothetical protein
MQAWVSIVQSRKLNERGNLKRQKRNDETIKIMGLKDERRLLDFEPSIFTREKLNTASGLVFCKSFRFFHKILS